MYRAPGSKSAPWNLPGSNLESSFTARASGLLATEFVLSSPSGAETGRLRPGRSGGRFVSENLTATFEASGGGYRMLAGGEALLVADPRGRRSLDALEISCDDRAYEAAIGLFRNVAVARRREGGAWVARVSGGFTGRRYEARFDAGDPCALPLAVFLLWFLTTERRRAYRRGGTM